MTNLLGIRCIAELVAAPQEQISILELGARVRGTETTGTPFILEQYSEILDPQALAEVRAEGSRLQAIVDDALERGEEQRAEEARGQIEDLTDSVRDARGIGGKSRAFKSSIDKAREAMHHNVSRAYAAIAPQAPTLVGHFTQAIKIARWCSYAPIPEITWLVSKRPS